MLLSLATRKRTGLCWMLWNFDIQNISVSRPVGVETRIICIDTKAMVSNIHPLLAFAIEKKHPLLMLTHIQKRIPDLRHQKELHLISSLSTSAVGQCDVRVTRLLAFWGCGNIPACISML